MANIGEKGILRHIDNPAITVLSASIGAGKTWITDADSSDTDFLKAVEAGKGLHYKGVLSANTPRMIEFSSNNLHFTVQEGHCEVETMVQFSDITGFGFCFGFNDQVLETSTNLPMKIDSLVVAATSESFVGFTFDTDATNEVLHCTWVDDSNVGQTNSDARVNGGLIKMSTMSLTAAKWLYLKVSLDDTGSDGKARATFLAVDHTGRSEERTFSTTIDRDVPLAYYFGAENAAATGRDIFLRHNDWAQTVPNM